MKKKITHKLNSNSKRLFGTVSHTVSDSYKLYSTTAVDVRVFFKYDDQL